jgi:flagellin
MDRCRRPAKEDTVSLRINTNTSAFNAYRNLSVTSNLMNNSLEKLSSGYRINKAADDAAGLAISESLKSQINGLTVAVRNAQDGVSVVQTAEGALNETTAILQRMRDLAVEANNAGAQNDTSIGGLDTEFQQLAAELDDISSNTEFNGVTLLDGNYTGTFQVGANNGDSLSIAVSTAMDSTLLGTSGAGTLDSSTAAGLIDSIDAAIEDVSSTRATLGAYQNRLDHKINNLNVTVENLTASNSRIRDTDMASEMVNFTKQQILAQAGTAMLAQANTAPQTVLRLLQ